MTNRLLVNDLIDETSSCINCGFCETVCPTFSGSDFFPTKGARGRVNLGKQMASEILRTGSSSLNVAESFYSCVDCYACLAICPAGVNAGKISQLARTVIAEGDSLSQNEEIPVAKMIARTTMKFKNPLGLRSKCASWAEGISFNDKADTLLYTGNMYQLMAYSKRLVEMKRGMSKKTFGFLSSFITAFPSLVKFSHSYYDKNIKMKMEQSLRDIVSLLKASGKDLKYLGKNEPYPGTFLYDLGYVDYFKEYCRYVGDLFHKEGIRTIITVDPHTYDILRNEYPKYYPDFDFEVKHYTDFIDKAILKSKDETVTMHESCHFALRGTPFNTPLELLRNTRNVIMPKRSGNRLRCCGGPVELTYEEISENVSQERLKELTGTGAKTIVTACPICFANLYRENDVVDLSAVLISQ